MPSMENAGWIPVAALALFDAQGRLLLQERPLGKRHAGLWEFPGGKVEEGESPRAALVREIAEELTITLDPADLSPASFAEEHAPSALVLLLYTARRWTGAVRPTEGQAVAWLTRAEAGRLELAPMDRFLLARLAGIGGPEAG